MDESSSAVDKATIRGKFSCPGGSPKKQNFPFQDSTMHYIAVNSSSPQLCLKLSKCCKCFFDKNPVVIKENMDWNHISSQICQEHGCDGSNCPEQNIKCKVWITGELYLNECESSETFRNVLLSLRSKVYRCDAAVLTLSDYEVIYDDFKFLGSNVKILYSMALKVIHNDKSIVMLEEILAGLPKIEKFCFTFRDKLPMITAVTLKNIFKLKNLEQLKGFTVELVPAAFDIEDLTTFLMTYKDVKIWMWFNRHTPASYKNQLDTVIDIVIKSKIRNRMIRYDGQDDEKLEILHSRYSN